MTEFQLEKAATLKQLPFVRKKLAKWSTFIKSNGFCFKVRRK